MRLRVYRDERNFALSRDYDDGEPLWEGPDGEHLSDERVHRPGWRELVVLDPDADARRLAEAFRAAVELDDVTHIEAPAPPGKSLDPGSRRDTRRAAAMWVDEGSCIHGHPDTSSDYCRACEQDTGSESARPDAATLREQIGRNLEQFAQHEGPYQQEMMDAADALLGRTGAPGSPYDPVGADPLPPSPASADWSEARPDAATLREQIAEALHNSTDMGASGGPGIYVLEWSDMDIPINAVMAILAEHGLVDHNNDTTGDET